MPTGDVAAKVALLDEKIKTERDNIDTARKALQQMDSAVDQTLGRSTTENGADKAVAIRRSQAKERSNLQKEISDAQKKIAALNEERAPIASELRKVEAEVGPIKYIAALIYGDNPDANILEKAVTWVIIIIVSVFDPLAVIMLLAAQMTFQWYRKGHDPLAIEEPVVEPVNVGKSSYRGRSVAEALETIDEQAVADEANRLLAEVEKEPETEVLEIPSTQENEVEQELQRGEELLAAEEQPIQLDVDERPGDYVVDDSKKKNYMTKDHSGKLVVKEVK